MEEDQLGELALASGIGNPAGRASPAAAWESLLGAARLFSTAV